MHGDAAQAVCEEGSPDGRVPVQVRQVRLQCGDSPVQGDHGWQGRRIHPRHHPDGRVLHGLRQAQRPALLQRPRALRARLPRRPAGVRIRHSRHGLGRLLGRGRSAGRRHGLVRRPLSGPRQHARADRHREGSRRHEGAGSAEDRAHALGARGAQDLPGAHRIRAPHPLLRADQPVRPGDAVREDGRRHGGAAAVRPQGDELAGRGGARPLHQHLLQGDSRLERGQRQGCRRLASLHHGEDGAGIFRSLPRQASRAHRQPAGAALRQLVG